MPAISTQLTVRGEHSPCFRLPGLTQIQFMLLLSRQGKVRLSKWYTTVNQKERAKILRELTPMVLGRPLKLCNFLDWKDTKVPLVPSRFHLPSGDVAASTRL